MDPLRSKVIATALTSRLFVMAVSFLADNLIPNHDAGVFAWVQSSNSAEGGVTFTDKAVEALFGGLTRWDAQYFLHVADNGYTYENTLAFFPLFPMAVRFIAEVIYWCQVEYGLIRFNSALILSAVGVNLTAFVLAAVTLHELSRKVLRDEYLAYKSALFFCLNPASVFFSAAYSESLHAAVSFGLMLKVERGFSFKMALLLAASTASRSNGLLNMGFVAYKGLKIVAKELAIHVRLVELGKAEMSTTVANIIGDGVVPTAFSLIAGIVPFVLFQWHGFTQFCGLTNVASSLELGDDVVNYAHDKGYKLPWAEPSDWCHASILPTSYNYVQSTYWNVGFLRYYQLKQLPQFILAAPILYLVLTQSRRFYAHHKFYCVRLGLTHFGMDPNFRAPSFDAFAARGLPRDCLVYVGHACALAVFCLLCVHVQVATRIICSSCPVVYWWAAMLTTPPPSSGGGGGKRGRMGVPVNANKCQAEIALKLEPIDNLESCWRNLVFDEYTSLLQRTQSQRTSSLGASIIRAAFSSGEWGWIQPYCAGYAVMGTVLFANYLPWT